MGDPTEHEAPGAFMRFMQRLMPKLTPVHVGLYRLLGGRFVDKASGGAPLVLVTTTGRRSGKPRTVALGHITDGDAVIVAGTNGGLPALPQWLLNLRADPRCELERGTERVPARAELLEGETHDAQWARFTSAFPIYDQARRFAGRRVPLVRISPTEGEAH